MKLGYMKNDFCIIGDTVEIYITNKYNEKFVLLIDLADFKKIKRYTWCVVKKRKRFYAACNSGYKTKNGYKNIYIHQYLLEYKYPLTCDHINLNGLDNRRSNLRICTNQENNRNKSLQSNNKSGVVGVLIRKIRRPNARARARGVQFLCKNIFKNSFSETPIITYLKFFQKQSNLIFSYILSYIKSYRGNSVF